MPLRTWRRLVLVISGALFAAIVYRWISLERLQRAAPAEILATPTPEPTPTRPPVISGKLDTAKLFNGITLHSTVETIPGVDAATERMQLGHHGQLDQRHNVTDGDGHGPGDRSFRSRVNSAGANRNHG